MVYHDISQEQLLLLITQAVQAELQKRSRQVPVGISVRHIHLTRDDVDKLFGYGYQLTPKKALSQPGQFACEECLDIIGPKGELKHEDRYLLCSDGLTDMLTNFEIDDILSSELTAEDCAQRLVDAALEKGGKDNVTVIVCRVL